MRVFRGFDELPPFNGAVVTVGSFDGLHRGHLTLLQAVVDAARESGGESVVLTFDSHPRVVLGHGEGLRLLTSTEEKRSLLDSLGVDNLIIIPFNREFSRLSSEEFVRRYLVGMVGMKRLVMGYNHHLGRGREGSHEDLIGLSGECGFTVDEVEEWRDPKSGNVSSTVVRRLISSGEIERANELLSRPFMILGRVDEARRVWVDDALKIEPPVGRYRALVNGVESQFNIDNRGIITICGDVAGVDVKMEVLSKIE